ncbi:MAG: hypothetical protein NWE99_04010 [Candidatus Bathyarchaeota archaeon]|nr:hypothetical protein [Candidatus Bathyarchaeota archaeon]
MFRYMAVKLTIRALSSLMPFPKQNAAEISSSLQTCRASSTYCESALESIMKTYGKIANGNVASPMQVNNCRLFPERLYAT